MPHTGQNGESDAARSGNRRVFVNDLSVEVSLSEFRIDIGQKGPGSGSGSGTNLFRFVTTPHHFETMQRNVDQAARRYIAEFGPISREGKANG